MNRPKDCNHPSPWNMRIWDEDNHEWLGQSDPDLLPYYGFDIRLGEVVYIQGIERVYSQMFHDRKLVWERSTGMTDKNGVEIYEGDIVRLLSYQQKVDSDEADMQWDASHACFVLGYADGQKVLLPRPDWCLVVGNIHEKPE